MTKFLMQGEPWFSHEVGKGFRKVGKRWWGCTIFRWVQSNAAGLYAYKVTLRLIGIGNAIKYF